MERVKQIVSSLARDGVFGKFEYVDMQPDETVVGAQFSSSLVVVTLTLLGPEGTTKIPLLIKQLISDDNGISRDSSLMFHNEVTMYKEILPGLGVEKNLYPQMFYSLIDDDERSENMMIILENLKYKNYKLSKTKIFLDFEHISVAIKKIAQFHSFSFIHKHKNMKSFQKIVKKLKDVATPATQQHEFRAYLAAFYERGIRPLLEKNISANTLETCLSLLNLPNMGQKLSSPEEPFAVLCHGDFCNNNVLYKFDENDRPQDCTFIDFQQSKYGSPAMDVFFFLYLHTTSELREKYWDEILKHYWKNLRKYVPLNIDIPSFEEFLKHFEKRAMYGYAICAFFLPVMIEEKPIIFKNVGNLPFEEKISLLASQGGNEGQRLISEIILHMLEKGYVKAFIEFCKKNNFEC